MKYTPPLPPKEFITNTNEYFNDAVENGYDIRMEEPEILKSMEDYANYIIDDFINNVEYVYILLDLDLVGEDQIDGVYLSKEDAEKGASELRDMRADRGANYMIIKEKII